jgi:hypothetical protein
MSAELRKEDVGSWEACMAFAKELRERNAALAK